ncbi:MAG: FecR family protein [Patescibacteria group bacterium]|nr:FecR family protein [Patescibacteria group bacterium]
MKTIGNILASVFGLLLIVGGVMFVFKVDESKSFVAGLMQKIGIPIKIEEGVRGMVEYVEGQVEKRASETDGWREVERDDVVKNGMEMRTLADSRAVLTFEDGSVVRLNADSLMKFKSEKELILIELSNGEVYNRVTKDEKREFAVEVDSYKVVALGTAFSVEKKEDSEVQVMVVESEVEIQGKEEVVLGTVEQGNKTRLNFDEVASEKITQDDLKDAFLNWNVENDEKYFEKKIVLNDLKKETVKKEVTKKTETKKEVVKREEKKKDDDEYATLIALRGKDDDDRAKFTWVVSGGYAPKGFKLVKSKQPNPVYPGDDYLYIKDPDDRSAVWKGFKKEKTYFFRICVYKGGKCGTYSNNVEIDFE